MSHHTRSSQSTVLSNWSRLQIERPQTRKERATFPRAIPHVFADARQLPVRLLKGQRLTRLIQYTGLGMIALMLTGCSGPTAPTVHAQEAAEPVRLMQPLHHNIPATFAGHSDGPVIYLCETQPRTYILPNGTASVERDHYLQYESCPRIPID